MLLGTLGARFLGNMLAGKGTNRAGEGELVMDLDLKKTLLPPHPLAHFEIQKYYQNEPKFNGVSSRDNLPYKIKDGVYVINIDEYSDIETDWIALYAFNNNVTYFHSFGVEYNSKEVIKFIGNKSIQTNIFRMQEHNYATCEYFYIGFIDFMLKD